MNTLAISRKEKLVKRAARYQHTGIFLPNTSDYVRGFLHEPIGLKDYDSGKEPVVDPKQLYTLSDDAWLTVNHYNALVLNSSNMLIADIDFGDVRLDRHAGATSVADVRENLSELHLLDNELHPFGTPFTEEFRFAEQSYRVYLTCGGCRVICTSIAVPWADLGWMAKRFMQFLRSDPDYIRLCELQQCYRARLTPKPWRHGECVCFRLHTEGSASDEIAPELAEQLRLHDELTLPAYDGERLA